MVQIVYTSLILNNEHVYFVWIYVYKFENVNVIYRYVYNSENECVGFLFTQIVYDSKQNMQDLILSSVYMILKVRYMYD